MGNAERVAIGAGALNAALTSPLRAVDLSSVPVLNSARAADVTLADGVRAERRVSPSLHVPVADMRAAS